ncbi:PepSY-associated TM region [Spirosomataceae bacterium TFI 002]|nr:PepSY-associated TM region [Spirosomataceae bacterium TFI 002]
MAKKNLNSKMRSLHRDLGFFLVGIMAMYAISGIVLVFRNTDFLKTEEVIEKTIKPNLSIEDLGKEIKQKNLKADLNGSELVFKGGKYNVETGAVSFTTKELPFILDKMTHLHKANTDSPVYFLNIFFGFSLLFFVVSAFWMYTPKMPLFKKGMYFVAAGAILTVVLIFV